MAATEFVPNQAKTEGITAHVIWLTTGLSCEGDSVAMTGATNPSLEDIITGAIPGMPRVVVHTTVLAVESGDEFMQAWYDAEAGKLDPFVLVLEGSVPNEKINGDGYWTGMGVNPANGQPITTNEWIDRLAPKASAVVAVGTCATYGGIPAMKNNPTGAMGLADYLGWNWKSKAGIPIVNIPGCPAQGDNITETLMYLVFALAGHGAAARARRRAAAQVAVRAHGARELQPRRLLRVRAPSPPSTARTTAAWSSSAARARWSSATSRCAAGSTASAAARTWAASAWRARCRASPTSTCRSWTRTRTAEALEQRRQVHLRTAPALGPQAVDQAQVRQGAGVAAQPGGADHRLREALVGGGTLDMATAETPVKKNVAVKEMSWDPVTRIVGSLGIHTEIDFESRQVLKCYSTSMVFRGFDIFMKGIDPRDAHFITSRICGICGDNHCTCSCLNQNMAYGVKPPPLGDYAFNLAESADFMFDHAIYNDCMANVDYSEQVVKDTNPGLLKRAEETSAPHSDIHGYKTIADIMRALNAFTGSFYLETLQVARYTREMYCLFGGRHTHPSTIMPGGCSADITHQTLTDYYVRLMRYMDYCKRTVPMHDDLYDFFYEALPGYEQVGYRDTDLVCWGAFDDPNHVDYSYRNMTDWGRHRFVTPGLVFKGELITTDLVEINLAIRILLGSSYFDDWTNEETFVTQDPLGNPVDKHHPWNKVTLPKPQARDWADKYSWVASPRMHDVRDGSFVANDTGGGPFARQWVTAKAGLVDIGYLKATGESIQMVLPKTGFMPEMELEWKIPQWSNAIERQRARTYHQAYSALVGLYNLEQALKEVRAGRTKSWNDFTVPESAVSVGFHEAARGVLSHHMVIREGKIANYQPYPPTPWNGNPRDVHGTPGPYEDAVQNTPIFEENGPEDFKGIDIMRAVHSFDPCLPCGVHMYGKGKVRKVVHTPTGMC